MRVPSSAGNRATASGSAPRKVFVATSGSPKAITVAPCAASAASSSKPLGVASWASSSTTSRGDAGAPGAGFCTSPIAARTSSAAST